MVPAEPLFAPRPAEARRRTPSLVDVTLDGTQRRAIDQPAGRALLVLGEAGHGKTTVLLHRVARLWRESAARAPRAAVLVPAEGLARLLQPLLRGLGVDVEVTTFDAFAAKQARRAFRRLPRESDATPASVMRFKRSPALRAALAELATREPGLVDDDEDAPVRRASRHATRGDLQHLFGDRIVVERVARAAGLPDHVVADVLERTRIQFSLTAEDEWRHVTDRRRLRAVDGRRIDDGTSTANAETLDVEDYPVLFELDRLRAEARGGTPRAPKPYDLVAVDEAQELAPLELALVGRSLAPGGSIVVSGDADQRTGEGEFLGWPEAMRELGVRRWTTTTLEIGYRCPPAVVALARAVRGGGRPEPPADVARYASEAALAEAFGRAIDALFARDPGASVAILCRRPMTARRFAPLLREHTPTRLVFDGRFGSRAPAQLTTVDEVKGLEFDYVVVPDADERTYPDDGTARRTLYVAVTRARQQVLLAATAAPSPILV